MTDDKIIFAKRLKSAREMKGFSMADLSDAIDNIVSPQAIYKYESGKMLPNTSILKSISQALQMPMDYFFKEYTVTLSNIEFRKKSSLLVRDRKYIESTSLNLVEKYFEIIDICGDNLAEFRKERNIVTSEEDVYEIVSNLRARYNLNDSQIPNVVKFLEDIGIIVIELRSELSFDGLSGLANNTPIIVLKAGLPAERKRFTALHELGHLVMNFNDTVDDKTQEKLCHLFASEMLLPRLKFTEIMGNSPNKKIALPDLANIQKVYGISIDALIYKAKEAGIIGERTMRTYHILKNQNPKFKEYADTSRIGIEGSDKFDNMVMRAYDCHLITTEQAAAFLGTTAADIVSKSLII